MVGTVAHPTSHKKSVRGLRTKSLIMDMAIEKPPDTSSMSRSKIAQDRLTFL